MKALCWYGKHDVRVEKVPDPKILDPHDAIIKITTSAICGSDLHLYDALIPRMERGDILGHEFMGEVAETGPDIRCKSGDRVVVPFTMSCGECFYCKRGMWSLCDNTNPSARESEIETGYVCAGLLRVFAPVRRVRRRAGAICASALCQYRTYKNSRWHS